MSANKVIYNLLSSYAPLTAIVNSRIYFGVIPQKATLPALTYALISEYETTSQAMTTIKLKSRVQITIASKDYAQVNELRQLVKGACNHKQGIFNGVVTDSVLVDGVGADFRDDELNIYYTTIDFKIAHDEPLETFRLLADIGSRLMVNESGDLLVAL